LQGRRCSVLRIAISLIVTSLLSITVLAFLMLATPNVVPSTLEVGSVAIGTWWIPVLPLGFVVAGLAATAVSVWATCR
jgi:hypothetical protein